MYNPKIDAYCESIDSAFLDYMTKSCNVKNMCDRVSNGLNKIGEELPKVNGEPVKTFNVIMVDGKNDFCGIKVYPDTKTAGYVFRTMPDKTLVEFCKSWLVTIDTYTVEIDANCFNKQKLNFSNKELTAMLLHEIAHIVYGSTVPETIYNSYMIHRQELKYGKTSIVNRALQVFYTIPALLACGYHVLRTGLDGKKEEYIADKLFGVESYRPYLYSAIDKIIRAYGTSTYLNKKEFTKVIDNLIAQNNVNITELATRRRIIKDDLLYQSANTHSKTIRKAYIDILKTLGIGFADRYTNAIIATESLFEDIDNGKTNLNGILNTVKIVDTDTTAASVMEGAFQAKECCGCCCGRSPKMPTGYDIDMVAVTIDKIHSNLDRMAVLDELYSLQQKLDTYTEYTKTNNLYDSQKYKIDRYAKTINDYIDAVKSKDIPVTIYNEIVNYPNDYSH